MVDRNVAMSPIGPALLRHPPGDRVPYEIWNLQSLVVEEADRPGVCNLTWLELGPHESIGTIVVGLNQVDRQLAVARGGGPSGHLYRTSHEHDPARISEFHH